MSVTNYIIYEQALTSGIDRKLFSDSQTINNQTSRQTELCQQFSTQSYKETIGLRICMVLK